MNGMTKLRIAIVDDHALLRSGLVAMLDYEPDIEVVGEASNGKDAVALFERVQPDVLVMDVTMPEMGGIEAAKLILAKYPEAKILLMTQHEEQQFLEAMMEVDVAGCIGKRAAGTEFVAALKAVQRGEFYLHPAMARLVARNTRKRFVRPEDTLTPREREVLGAIVRGCTNTQIARDMALSVKTVEWHRSNLMNKLDAHGVAELVRYAIEHGLAQNADTSQTPIDRLD